MENLDIWQLMFPILIVVFGVVGCVLALVEEVCND